MKKDFKNLEQFKDFVLREKPDVEAYTFRGKDFQFGFTMVLTAGRIFISGDAGDNVFTVGGSNQELKNWLINVDIDYALSKSHQKREYFDKDYAEKYIREMLLEERYHDWEINRIIEHLDFSSHDLLLNSMSNLPKIFPDYWECNLLQWSPMQVMQYKQLLFAGKYFNGEK
ncbi:MAG: hypothetical protein WC623_22530 [Pedobacter sp.]|uniref:hypothetical protein n=1 Tax=Pedobacter sp. TaxID=1411316 RepID=UPI00356AD2D5